MFEDKANKKNKKCVCLIQCETVVPVTSFVLERRKLHFRGDKDF